MVDLEGVMAVVIVGAEPKMLPLFLGQVEWIGYMYKVGDREERNKVNNEDLTLAKPLKPHA